MADSGTWKRAEELYHAALKVDEAGRSAFLEDACAGDEALLREVQSLLGYAEPAGRFLEAPPAEAATKGAHAGTLIAGQRLGQYEVVARIGAGGMGEVYKAKDRKLGRQVALKVLPEELAGDTERLKRFAREARAASALNHPNTVTIHDIDEQDGVHYIAMELVAGQTLKDRIESGSMPVSELVGIAREIARGLAKAHAAGIVHRDLKPGNIMLTDDGLAKILDFGLATLTRSPGGPSEVATAEVVTRAGEILGTAAYMSPEQASGRPVDHRSDQFSFGCILYEMATGQRPFEKGSLPQTLAAIIEARPASVAALNEDVPPALVAIIERCLARDPEGRYESTGDLSKALQRTGDPQPAAATSSRRGWALPAVAALVLAVAGTLYWTTRPGAARDAPSVPSPLVPVPLTSFPGLEDEPTFSPDGSQVAFSWDGEGQDNRDIYVKVIGSEQPLRLTRDTARDGSPAWSPDGGQIAFLRARAGGGSEVRLVPPTGGPERRLADVAASAEHGLAWSPDGHLLAVPDRASSGTPLAIVLLDVETGAREKLTAPAAVTGRGDTQPAFSPDGQRVAFKRARVWPLEEVCVVSATGRTPRCLAPAPWTPSRVAWTAAGDEVVFVSRPTTTSRMPWALWAFPVGGGDGRMLPGSEGGRGVAISRATNRLVYAQQADHWDVWQLEVQARGPVVAEQTRFLASTRVDGNPQFSPDNSRVAFTSNRNGTNDIWVADSEGRNPLRLTRNSGDEAAAGSPRWSPDGKSIVYDLFTEGGDQIDIYVIGASGGPSRRITRDPAKDVRPSWSRDGRWIYFASDRSGEWQVWRAPAEEDGDAEVQMITRNGGYASIPSPDGRYLYFARLRANPENPENSIWRVPVDGGPEEVVIESLRSSDTNWDVTEDGIYYVDQEPTTEGVKWVVRLLRFATGEATDVAELRYAPGLYGPALGVSSDGRRILSAHNEPTSDLMLVEDFR